MALHDRDVIRTMACGIAGLSVVVDSLSAIKYAKVKVIRNDDGLAIDYSIEGDFPKYGNDDERVDEIAVELVKNCYDANAQNVNVIFENVGVGKKQAVIRVEDDGINKKHYLCTRK